MKEEEDVAMSQDPRPQPPTAGAYPSSPASLSEEAPNAGRGKTLLIIAWAVGAVVALGALLGFTLSLGPNKAAPDKGKPAGERGESSLAGARSALLNVGSSGTTGKLANFNICREALQQLNGHLAQTDSHAVPVLSPSEKKELARQFELRPDELAEVGAPTFTTLDAHHLDACFLLRDVARSLELKEVKAPGGKSARPTPLDQATVAFAWVVRQVRLPQYPDGKRAVGPQQVADAVPPAFVLRRGWGTALERALIFLALLEQFGAEGTSSGPQGCLLFVGDRLWACGVAVGDEADLYLFDPFLGLAIPGPGGHGVATLGQARWRPDVLKQLSAGAKQPYDVTAEQAREARPLLVCPLSALAPRMSVLQDRLLRDQDEWTKDDREPTGKSRTRLPAPIAVRLKEDVPGALARLGASLLTAETALDRIKQPSLLDWALARIETAVAGKAPKGAEVAVWPASAGVLRNFLPPAEGGGDSPRLVELGRFVRAKLHRLELHQLMMVPWEDFPARFQDPETFGFHQPLGRRVRTYYAGPFWRLADDAGSPRDLLLRGNFNKTANLLVEEHELWRNLEARRRAEINLEKDVDEWLKMAFQAYANLSRARGGADELALANKQIEQLWGPSAPIHFLLGGAHLGPYTAELAYLLALCKHEQAERLQARLGLLARLPGTVPNAGDLENARLAWVEAEGHWARFPDRHEKRPGAVAARRMHGEALARLGRWPEAAKVWRDLSGPLTEQEKLANLYRARQAEKKGK